jgi:hypothetical protein
MSFSLSTPVTGAAQTGFTSPTYTLAADQAPDVNGKQFVVTAIGGTQPGVTSHSTSSPFTVTAWRPKVAKSLGVANPTTGIIPNIPNNTYKVLVRKGVTPAVGQQVRPMAFTCEMPIPAGADANDAANVRAGLSLLIGVLTQIAASLGDTLVTGTL